LAGRVVDPKGAPLADAALLVTSDPSKTDRPKGWRGTWEHGTTEADGTFRIAGLGDAPWVVTATLDDVGTAKKEGVAAGTRDLEIVIAPAGIAGRAVDAATAKPIASFRAFARRSNQPTYQVPERLSETAFSSGDGRFEIRGLAPGRYFPFLEGDGYAETRGPEIEVKAGEIANAGDLKVDGASTLRGRVVEAANGEPVVNASVEAIHEGGNAMTRGVSAFTSADGTFEVRAVRTGRVRAVAWKENRAEAQSPIVEVRPGVVADAGVLALRAGGAIEGAALGAGGAPMAGGRAHAVFVSDASARPLRRSYVEAPLDDDGSFRLDGLAAGAWDVTAQPRAADDDRLKSVQRAIHATATVEEGRTTRIEFPLSPSGGCLVRGRVVRAGNGVAGVGVRIELDAPDGRRKRDAERDLSASTDKDGRFSIEHVPAGSGQAVMGTSRGIGDFTTHRQKLTIPDAPETEIELVLPTEATIAGRVTTTGDERPLADIPISAWQSGAGGSSSHAMRTTNPDGGYRIAGVPPGRYRVTAGGPAVYVAGGSDSPSEDFSTDSKEVDVADGATATLDFALEVGARAIVEVVSHDGTPVAHSVVSLIPIGEGGAKKMACGGVTNDLGVARVRGVPPGTWAARAESGAIPFAQSDPQGVALAAETRFRLQLKRGVAVRVRAVDAADAPVPVGSVTLYSGGAQVGHGWPKGGNEAAEIELVPGRYAIQVNAADDRAGVVEIEIGDSPPKEVVVKVAAPDKKPG
ncbi:MAG TPA: carboxypeptidase regulatory-like domain-containing protein, partial [Planctomycetota bacterium]|nr:carboxypeptidase regulatory-like domain-containing protein [Planctomycetota bacterium]